MSQEFHNATAAMQQLITKQNSLRTKTLIVPTDVATTLDIVSDHGMTVRQWVTINYPAVKVRIG